MLKEVDIPKIVDTIKNTELRIAEKTHKEYKKKKVKLIITCKEGQQEVLSEHFKQLFGFKSGLFFFESDTVKIEFMVSYRTAQELAQLIFHIDNTDGVVATQMKHVITMMRRDSQN